MSDRKNRDVGRKREQQKHKYDCDCWLCAPENKKRIDRMAKIPKNRLYSEIKDD